MESKLKFKEPILVTQPILPDFNKYCSTIHKVWDNKWLTNSGPLNKEFEEKVKVYLGVNNISSFVNGHLSLEIAIKALGLTGEIITTPFTFVSTTNAILNCGLTPVFCDISPETYTIDCDKIESFITEKTSAILAVHVYGNPCDVYKIDKIAKKHNLKVIYDAAHAFGVKINNIGIGNFGDISMFSLHATKVFNSIEGGLLSFRDKKLKRKLESLRNFGITSSETIEYIGTNAKMNEFQSAMGICNLKNLNEKIFAREKIVEKYREGLKSINGVYLLNIDNSTVKQNYAYFPILINEKEFGMSRDELHDKLKEYNVITRKYFYPLCNKIITYESNYNTPIAEKISNNILVLPLYADLSLENVSQIIDIIYDIYYDQSDTK